MNICKRDSESLNSKLRLAAIWDPSFRQRLSCLVLWLWIIAGEDQSLAKQLDA